MKKTAVVICPGRGTYNKDELGYLKKYHSEQQAFIGAMDAYRRDQQQLAISDLDKAEKYRLNIHATGDNASALIYTCALADFHSINQDKYEIVAITGNSMGWYLALAAAQVLNLHDGMHVVNSMGTTMHQQAEGGQVIFPLCNEQWQRDEELIRTHQLVIEELQADKTNAIYSSIDLGGMSVLAANAPGLKALLKSLPKTQERYPFSLPNHGAFHSPLMQTISQEALNKLPSSLFKAPKTPLIDGRGFIWQPYKSNVDHLHSYTLGEQVCKTYNYSKAIEVACKEFSPDHLIILGPGTTLGAPSAQQLIKMRWLGMESKDGFKQRQHDAPFILSMGMEDQRALVIN